MVDPAAGLHDVTRAQRQFGGDRSHSAIVLDMDGLLELRGGHGPPAP